MKRNTLPKNEVERRRLLHRSEPAVKALGGLTRRRSDNVQLADRVRGKVATGAGKQAVRVTNEPEKTSMYEKPACGELDSQRYMVRRRRQEPQRKTGSLLRVPEGASPEEQAKMRRWVAQAEEISRRLNR